jgi:hypothetical protein
MSENMLINPEQMLTYIPEANRAKPQLHHPKLRNAEKKWVSFSKKLMISY